MGLISGASLAFNAANLLRNVTKDQPNGYVIVTRNKGRLRTRYKIACSSRRSVESKSSANKKSNDEGMEIFLSVQANNPQLIAQKLLQRYAKRSNLGEWFGLSKKQLQDLEEIVVLIYAATG